MKTLEALRPTWPVKAAQPHLGPEDVHVWSIALNRPAEEVERLSRLLTPEERGRAERMHAPAVRMQFHVGRGLMRTLLGRYLGCDPRAIAFRLTPLGKPLLATPSAELYFNLSHSHGVAVLAITRFRDIGIDVEHVRPMANDMAMAQRYFSPIETRILREIGGDTRMQAFFNAWTRKEAFLKASGNGLVYGLERVEVTLHPDDPPRVIRLDGCEASAARWSLQTFVPTPNYVGALAVPGHGYRTSFWHWPD